MKDWTGNKRTTFSTLGASNHADHNRADRDYYAADPVAILPLLKQLSRDGEILSDTIWECSCGNGHLSIELEKQGYKVSSSDIIQRDFPCSEIDFLNVKTINKFNGDIITNPPYKYAQEFIEKALERIDNNCKVIMFLKLTFLEGRKRKLFFKQHPPKYIYVFSGRIKCAINGNFDGLGSSAVCYAWFVWVKGYNGKPMIGWI